MPENRVATLLTGMLAPFIRRNTRDYSGVILAALQGKPHVYAGTCDRRVVAKRRAANKVARRSRRMNQMRAR